MSTKKKNKGVKKDFFTPFSTAKFVFTSGGGVK